MQPENCLQLGDELIREIRYLAVALATQTRFTAKLRANSGPRRGAVAGCTDRATGGQIVRRRLLADCLGRHAGGVSARLSPDGAWHSPCFCISSEGTAWTRRTSRWRAIPTAGHRPGGSARARRKVSDSPTEA